MLEFLRKYQRFFFGLVTVVITASLFFFGTGAGGEEILERKDRVIGHAIDGSPIGLLEVEKIARFLDLDRSQGNVLNDGVLLKDFLETGLADLLVKAYFDPLKEGVAARLERVRRYKPYSHPMAAQLSAKEIWKRFLPSLHRELETLQAEKEATPETFTRLFHLYREQNRLPPESLRRMLQFHQQQLSWLHPDPRLNTDDFSLFGFHTATDWFGRDFLHLAAQFILNGAAAASEKGYQVTSAEAKGDLLNQFQEGKPGFNFHQYLRMLGFQEKDAVDVWQKILLFRRYFHDVGQSVFVDQLALRHLSEFADETAVIQKYEWPSALQVKNLLELIELQIYLKAVAKDSKNSLSLPKELLNATEVAGNRPELVQTVYRVQGAEISKSEIGLRASMKEVWNWQLDAENWKTLRKEFSALPTGKTREERFQGLKSLSPAEKVKVDLFARKALVDLNRDWIEDAIQSAQTGEKLYFFSAAEKENALATWFEVGSGGTFADSEKILKAIQVEKIIQNEILTFEKAKPYLLEDARRFLKEKYPNANPEMPLQEALSLLSLKEHFLLKESRNALEALRNDPNDSSWVKSEGNNAVYEQFKLEKKEIEIQRSSGLDNWMKPQAFIMLPNEWSPIHLADNGEISFFYLAEKKSAATPILEQIAGDQQILAADAQRYLATRLLESVTKKNALVIPIQNEGEVE